MKRYTGSRPVCGPGVCTDPVTGAVGWDMTQSQSDWTHPLKTQQLSGPFGKYDVTSHCLLVAHCCY